MNDTTTVASRPYATVNALWPPDTNDGRDLVPTAQEAVTACRRLYRFAMGRPFRGKVRVTSGNRRTWIRRGVLIVNPDEGVRYAQDPDPESGLVTGQRYRGGGWHEIVHSMSHYCANRLYSRKVRGHSSQHAFLEKQMIEKVVSSGWLDGALKRPDRPAKPKPDVRLIRRDRVLARIKRWQARQKRAETELRKLRQRARYYEKALAAG